MCWQILSSYSTHFRIDGELDRLDRLPPRTGLTEVRAHFVKAERLVIKPTNVIVAALLFKHSLKEVCGFSKLCVA